MGDLSGWQIHSVLCDILELHGCSSHRLCTEVGVRLATRSAIVVVVVVVVVVDVVVVVVVVVVFVAVIVVVLLVRMFGV